MGEIDRKEVVAVALLAVGMLLIAHVIPVLQSQSAAAAQVQVQQEIEPDDLTLQTLTQIRRDATVAPVVEYERLSNESRSVFNTGRQDVYLIRQESDADDAVLQSAVLYDNGIYLRQVQETQSGVELRYVNRSGDIGALIATPSLMSDEQRSAFVNATERGSVNITVLNRGLTAYDYVYDNGTETYYETSTDRSGNVTVFSVEETDVESIVSPVFTSTDEMDDDVREAVVGGIEGENPVITGDLMNRVQENSLVEHDGSYYQIAFGQASPPITDALEPINFAGMGLGLLLILGGVFVASRVYKEKT